MAQVTEPNNRPWQLKLAEFMMQYNLAISFNPDLPLNQIAKNLNTSPRTIARMLAVSRHIKDPKISKSITLNQAYGKVKELYPAYQTKASQTQNEISSIASQIFPNGDKK